MQTTDKKNRIVVTTVKGLTTLLKDEIATLGLEASVASLNRVETEGSLEDCMRLNLSLRTAYHVLYHLNSFPCNGPDELYRQCFEFPWEEWLSPETRFSVASDTDHPSINDSRFPSLRLKDAIADRIRRVYGRRPDSGAEKDQAVFRLYWKGNRASIYADTSGEPLSKRGYRKMPYKAPMQEPLAAGVLLTTCWNHETPLVNPMCGSGTLAIEALLIAMNRAPALSRTNFGFMHLLGYDKNVWGKILREAKLKERPIKAPIIATDLSEEAMFAARQNARTAGVEEYISFETCAFEQTTIPEGEGIVILNPPYGIRLEEEEELGKLYSEIGDFFKKKCAGYTGYLFTGNRELLKKVGLKPRSKDIFFSAKIECRLASYELYSGTRNGPVNQTVQSQY